MRVQITNFYKNIKIKNQFLFLSSIIFTLFNFSIVLANSPYLMSITKSNDSKSGSTEFCIYIESTEENFTLTSYQCALNIGKIKLMSNHVLQYIEGSSDLVNEPNLYVGIDNIDGERELTFVSYIGNDRITRQRKLVGKFILEGIEIKNFNPTWNFDGVISTIITGNDFNNITTSSNHIINKDEVIEEKETLPTNYQLSQNYPNPFNPTTKVQVTMKDDGNASLVIYNLLGEKMLDVFDGDLLAGIHEININAGNLTSGIYIYQLKVDNKFLDFRKMNLVK